jgi:hypothetical protein
MGKGNGDRGEMYTIPIIGWVPYGDIAYASFE